MKTKIFFDTEFTGLRQDTSLISIGLISETGFTFYAELIDYKVEQLDDWLVKNIIGNLLLDKVPTNTTLRYSDGAVKYKGNMEGLKKALIEWFSLFDEIEMWGDLLVYDWMLLCEVFGGPFNIPEKLYYIPMDLCTLLKMNDIDPDISREAFAGLADGEAQKHNALWDALVIKACCEKLFYK